LPYYETVFIARQDISATQVESLADAFTKTIEDRGGQIAKREVWGLRPLAFRMKKQRKAHYVLFNIDAPAPAVHEMERQMRLNEDILRHLTVRVDALEEGPSAMMQMRAGRGDDRPRRDDRFRSSPRPAEPENAAAQASDSPDDGDATAADAAAPVEEGDER
jgi:small subunit ribosomal protein S6